MNDNNPNEGHLLLREVLNEFLIRDLVLFIIVYLLTICQEWNNILLLLFPLISFAFSIFFKILATNRYRVQLGPDLNYYPLGSERRNSSRFFFSSIFLSIFLLWMGYESYLNPQLIDNFFIYFSLLFILIYTFSFIWIFIDIWKFAIIKIRLENEKFFLSVLDKKTYLRIFLIGFLTFFVLNFLNIAFTLFNNGEFLSIFPGFEMENVSESYLYIIYLTILIVSPVLTIVLLVLIYRYLHNNERASIKEKLEKLPQEIREKITTQLKMKFKKLNSEVDRE